MDALDNVYQRIIDLHDTNVFQGITICTGYHYITFSTWDKSDNIVYFVDTMHPGKVFCAYLRTVIESLQKRPEQLKQLLARISPTIKSAKN